MYLTWTRDCGFFGLVSLGKHGWIPAPCLHRQRLYMTLNPDRGLFGLVSFGKHGWRLVPWLRLCWGLHGSQAMLSWCFRQKCRKGTCARVRVRVHAHAHARKRESEREREGRFGATTVLHGHSSAVPFTGCRTSAIRAVLLGSYSRRTTSPGAAWGSLTKSIMR